MRCFTVTGCGSKVTESSADRPLPPAVVRQAIAWNLRLEPTHGVERDALADEIERWCGLDPDHRLAWQRIGRLRGEFRDMARQLPDQRTSVPVLQRASLDLERRKALKLLVAACAIGGPGLWLARTHSTWGADYTTTTGERRLVTLADGTQVTLNTASALDVVFDDRQRLLILRGGEVLVESGADSASPHRRPLRLQCRFGLCEALGTRFAVRENDDSSQLSVTEGRVELNQPDAATRIVESGETVRFDGHGLQRLTQPALDPSAWSRGMLAVTDIRLEAFVAELARYRRGFIGCDEAVAGLRLSGVFQLDSPRRLLRHLERTLPVKVVSRTDWWVRIEPT